MTKKKIKIIVGILIIPFLILMSYAGSWFLWSLNSLQGLDYYARIKDNLRQVDSNTLIRKVNTFDLFSPYPEYAIEILVERQETKAVPKFIRILQSRRNYLKPDVMWALGMIKDPRAINPLLNIVKRGAENAYYYDALEVLSKMQYDPVFPIVLDLAHQEERMFGIVGMLRDFGKPEVIPILKKFRKDVPKDNSIISRLDLKAIDEAIAHLELIQKQQEQQKNKEAFQASVN